MKSFFQLRESLVEKTMELAGVTFQNMEHCPGAVSAFKRNLKDGASKEDVVKAAKAVDAYLAIEDKAKKSGATEADVAKMKGLIDKAKSIISDLGLKGHTYHDMHLDRVKDMVDGVNEAVQSADKKPEKYVGPDGKTKIRMVPVDRQVVGEKAVSQAQQKAAGAALAAKRGDMDPSELVGASKEMYDTMTRKELEDFASTKHKGLPKKVAEAKDPNEYDKEGDMAKTQLRAIIKDAEHMIEMFEDDENLPEWVQNKITKAQDYLNSAHTYMMNNGDDEDEMNEQFVKTTPGHLVKTADRIGAKFDSKKQAYFKNGVKIGHVQTASGPGTAGLSGRAKETFYIHKKLKEEVSLDEDISKMSHGRLKWHMNTGVPHGSYSNAEMKAERDRRMKHRDSADAYKKAKPGLSEVLDSPEKMDRYRAKAQSSRDRAAKSAVATNLRSKDKPEREHPAKDLKTMAKRTAGLRMVDRSAARKFRNQTESVDEAMTASQHRQAMLDRIKKSGVVKTGSMANETKAAPKGFHFTKDGKLKRGDADTDGPGGARLRADPLDKQRSKIPPVSEAKPDAAEVLRRRQQMKNISTSDKDKLLKVRQMLDKEKRK